ncbi:Copine-5, partial [Tinamus guttatus]
QFGRTEVIDNTLNPDFVRKFILDYFFEEKQNLRFDLYDVDSKSPDLSKHDFLDQAFCTLGEIVGSAGSRPEKASEGVPGKKCGTIILLAEELGNCRDVATLQFCANKLDKKDFFGKSDPFMVFYRSNEDGTFTICHKTEVVRNTLNPVWQAFAIPVRALCNGDYDRGEEEEEEEEDGKRPTEVSKQPAGEQHQGQDAVVNPKKKMKKKKYLHSGTVTLLSFAVESDCTFLDYIKGGTQINFTVAIDFTASNGNPSQSTSLHYMSPYQLNAYTMALRAVGEIIQDYDSDKMFPALGFGAKIPPDGHVSHEFPLGRESFHRVHGDVAPGTRDGQRTGKLIAPWGAGRRRRLPKGYLEPPPGWVLRRGIEQGGSRRWIRCLPPLSPQAAKLPMSIIIVGVGQAEFDAMVELDGDDVRISSRGKVAERDIVQFVPFRDYMMHAGNQVLSMARLAKDVLAEIPEQLVSYMKGRGIKPQAAPEASGPP